MHNNDPSTQCGADTTSEGAIQPKKLRAGRDIKSHLEETYRVSITGVWTLREMGILRDAFNDVAAGMTTMTWMEGVIIDRKDKSVGDRLDAEYKPDYRLFKRAGKKDTLYLYDRVFNDTDESACFTVIHEMGHRFDHTVSGFMANKDIWTAIGQGKLSYGNYCAVHPISECDAKDEKRAETFAQAFAYTYFSGEIGRVKPYIRPWNATDYQRDRLDRAKAYVVWKVDSQIV